jgi:hypothetical protein
MNDLNTLFPRALKAINEIIEHEYNISRKNYRQTRHSTLVSKVLCHLLLRSDSSLGFIIMMAMTIQYLKTG